MSEMAAFDLRSSRDEDIALMQCRSPSMRRESPRPIELRNQSYDDQFDWDTIFYDVYRVGRYVVLQGPPFRNFLPLLKQSEPLAGAMRGLFASARVVRRTLGNEIWWKTDRDRFDLDGPLGRFDIGVQPNLSHLFQGRRVIHTLSKDNDPHWIEDWVRFYRRIHGADGVLLYDNASTRYSVEELRARLRTAFPDMVIEVVSWRFRYGPQGGMAGAVNGVEAPWDSDFCQTGSLQHARFRLLREARSVLNVDVDELVLSNRGRSVFEAAEASRTGFVKFAGRWISGVTETGRGGPAVRHGDFRLYDPADEITCPPKWCLVPGKAHDFRHSWSVHNLFGARANRSISNEFTYRHMRAISNNWKADRADERAQTPAGYREDTALNVAFDRAGMLRNM